MEFLIFHVRRLPEFATLAYDRRGYQGSRPGGVVGLQGHMEDLLALAETARAESSGQEVGVVLMLDQESAAGETRIGKLKLHLGVRVVVK